MKSFDKKQFLRRLGARLSALRKSRGVGQDRLTEAAGLAKGTVSRIENGAVDPRVTTLLKLAHGLEVAPPKLLEVAFWR